MKKDIYEDIYNKKNNFSFGKNWQKFLVNLNEERIEEAKKSLVDFLGGEEKIKGKTFMDIGCGSGLFSLAAYKLGASSVVSVDVDDFSVSCANYLNEKEGKPSNWIIKKGSALDREFINSLGKFDIVYSWGVLHHTGDMYSAFDNVVKLVDNKGIFYLAIYNNNIKYKLEGSSYFWVREKKIYNNSNFFIKKMIETVYIFYYVIGLIVNFKNPIEYIGNYSSLRGMSFYTDIKDWLGGYPYEFATTEEIINYFKKHNLICKKNNPARSIGCNEFFLESI